MLPSPDRWKQIEALFHESLELKTEARAAFLHERCGSDKELRDEVEALLEQAAGSLDLLRHRIVEAAQYLPAGAVTLAPGTGVSHYQVVSLLATGGMGHVYLAEDTTLKRKVAIKVLSPAYTRDEAGLLRFEREAQAASALNHPNIVTIHECGQVDDLHFIVSEFVDGSTLRQKLSNGRLELNTTLEIAIQIAAALDVAHTAGIIHRDIKPENVMVRNDGLVKILDFGIAKLSKAPTLLHTTGARSSVLTQPGMLIGTVAYMSPEQATGKELDSRTDLFSFGVVLYEMATGATPFPGETAGAVIERMLTQPPIPPLHLNPDIPTQLENIITESLRKDPTLRYQHAGEMRSDLQQLKQASAPQMQAPVLEGKPAWGAVKGRLRWIIAAATAIALAIAVIAGYFASRRPPRPADKGTIVLTDFSNTTGDPVFDDTLKQGLSVQLEQSPFLDLVSERKVNDTLKLMGHPAGDSLTPEVAREICQRTGSNATLSGSIAALGSQYVIGLKAVNCQTGDTLAEAQQQASSKEAVLKALDAAAATLRGRLGESLSSVEKYGTPLEEATTPSLEALKAYSLGQKTAFAKGATAALPFYRRAVELDPNFAMPYRAMSVAYSNLNEVDRAAENARKAFELREKVSERERFHIEADYYFLTTGELEKATQVYELWRQIYPRDATPYGDLGVVSTILGNSEKALDEAKGAMRLQPDNANSYGNLAGDYANLNRLEEAEAVYKEAEERKLENEYMLTNRYLLAFLKGDAAQMTRLAASAMRKPGVEDLVLFIQADTEAWHGKLERARELTRRAVDLAQHNDAKETAAMYQAVAGLREVESGNREQARATVKAAVKLAPNREVRAIAALVLARAGDTAAADKLAAELDHAFPLDTLVQSYWLPTIRGGVALQRKDPNRAIELLQASTTIELADPTGLNVSLCPAYLRGEAYLMLHNGKAAAAEYQKFVDHWGPVANFPWGALARLGLARAYATQGDTTKALSAYQEFLTLWKDADPDVPVFKQAKAEYAKLQN